VKVVVCCKICSKEQSLKFQSTWKRHYLSHGSAEDKPHKCTHCGKAYVQSCSLKYHIKAHHSLQGPREVDIKNENW